MYNINTFNSRPHWTLSHNDNIISR